MFGNTLPYTNFYGRFYDTVRTENLVQNENRRQKPYNPKLDHPSTKVSAGESPSFVFTAYTFEWLS